MFERDYDYYDFQEIEAEIGRIESEGIWGPGDDEDFLKQQEESTENRG